MIPLIFVLFATALLASLGAGLVYVLVSFCRLLLALSEPDDPRPECACHGSHCVTERQSIACWR
jgi:hypothetical protein